MRMVLRAPLDVAATFTDVMPSCRVERLFDAHYALTIIIASTGDACVAILLRSIALRREEGSGCRQSLKMSAAERR